MGKARVLLKFDGEFTKKRFKRFANTILPILVAVSILYTIQYLS